MCEYCGCQAVTVIARLTDEHDTVVAMIGEARAAITRADPDAAAAVARRMSAVLGPHTHVEEHGLFPALAGEYPDHVDVLRAEHRRIEAVLAEAAGGTPADPTWLARLAAALYLLREHILKEQDGVFPAALISLGPDDWERIGQVRAAHIHATPARPG
jgi:hemerythrin-like domain-containing protein